MLELILSKCDYKVGDAIDKYFLLQEEKKHVKGSILLLGLGLFPAE